MPPQAIFALQMILGYVVTFLYFGTYLLPKLRAMHPIAAQRAIATLHSFRFFGLVLILPGLVGPNLPGPFATFAAYGDFATGVLAILALLTIRVRPLFLTLVVACNVVGVLDILLDYYHAVQVNLPALAGQLGATYVIPVLYVPLLMITHVVALSWVPRARLTPAAAL